MFGQSIENDLADVKNENGQLRAEIERLTERYTQASTAYMYATSRAQHYEAEIERLRTNNVVDVELLEEVRADHKRLQMALNNLYPEIERLTAERDLWESRTKQGAEIIMGNVAEIERLSPVHMTRNEAYLTVVEGWLRDNRGVVFTEGAVDDLCDRIAAEITRREPKS